ncbi:hypothetical protein ACRALDRAFT_1065573 [Sodiomyces alcalophilus JCM 7366]|uniref:uncharacterized protein n=1 Tax=Sodiomyces alcalophilus JCM 7366 TaxID=591952 RepID=UPI0039B43B8D
MEEKTNHDENRDYFPGSELRTRQPVETRFIGGACMLTQETGNAMQQEDGGQLLSLITLATAISPVP